MKLKIIALMSGIIFSTTSLAAVSTSYEKDGSLLIKSTNNQGAKIEYKMDKDSELLKEVINYNLKVYQVESTNSVVNTTGVYNNDSNILNINGKLLFQSKSVGNPLTSISSNDKTPYIKSVITKTHEDNSSESKKVKDFINSGFNLTVFEKAKDIYVINLSQSNLEDLKNYNSIDNDYYIQLPSISTFEISTTLYIPDGKTALIESPKYKFNGKEYHSIYLLSAKK